MSKPERETTSIPVMSAGDCWVRLGWMLFGTAALVISTTVIASSRSFPSAADAVFWFSVVACIALRYLDVSRRTGLTVTGEPATMRHWRRYALIMGVAAPIVWGAAHAISYLSR